MAQAVRLLPTPYTIHRTPYTFLLPFRGRSGGASDIKPKDYPIITEGLPKDKTPICTIRGFYYIYT